MDEWKNERRKNESTEVKVINQFVNNLTRKRARKDNHNVCDSQEKVRDVGLLGLPVEKPLSLLTIFVAFLGLSRKRPVSHLK
jgi:hypothetical protein